jgi:hypothetical protein
MTIVLAVLLATAAPAKPLSLNPVWGTLTRKPALRLQSVKVEIGTIVGRRGPEGIHFWLKRTLTDRDRVETGWTTTLACPAARPALARMEEVSASPDVPGLGNEELEITLDGVSYTLETPGRIGRGYGRFAISSNVGTPLAGWADATLATLEPCWSASQPG